MLFFSRLTCKWLLCLTGCLIGNLSAQVSITEVFSALRFHTPTAIVSPDDGTGRLAIASREGQVYIFDDDHTTSENTLFLDLAVLRDRNETGLIGFAFHPDYSDNGKFYVFYSTDPSGDNHHDNLISEFTVSTGDANVADPSSERVIINLGQWPAFMHNSGCLQFGPDGYLYAITGDPTQTGSQDLNSLFGKMIRIDVNNTDAGLEYAIPPDNPFAGSATGREEIWAYGFRNPWQFSFDSQTGKNYAGGVGGSAWEWIDTIVGGGNYRWPELEGSYITGTNTPASEAQKAGVVMPFYEYTPMPARGTVIGGYVYRGPNASLNSVYIFARRIGETAWGLVVDGNQITDTVSFGATDGGATCFGTGEDKELYMATDRGIFIFTGTGPGLSIGSKSTGPDAFYLSAISPNPFSLNKSQKQKARFSINLVDKTWARIEIFNLAGTVVKTLANKNFNNGRHLFSWDGTNQTNHTAVPGTYFYGITSTEFRRYNKFQVK